MNNPSQWATVPLLILGVGIATFGLGMAVQRTMDRNNDHSAMPLLDYCVKYYRDTATSSIPSECRKYFVFVSEK